MAQSLDYLKESPSQTAGPYVHIGCTPNFAGIHGVYETDLGSGPLYSEKTPGERLTLVMRVIDGSGTLLRDAMVEIWQADASGLYNSAAELRGTSAPGFAGWGRSAADPETGEFRFETIKPGKVPFPDGRLQAPHVTIWIVARGINLGLHTRMYFSDEDAANEQDPLLSRIEHRVRVPTLIGKREGSVVTFDIHIQGPQETVFLDI